MIATVEKVLFLKSIDLFRQIAGEELVQLAAIAEEVEFSKDATIFAEGDLGDSLYLIIEGRVRVHKNGNNGGRDATLAELSARDCFGEMSILDSEPRSASVTTLSDLVALRIQREDFHELLQKKSEIATGVIKVLTHRLRQANKKQ